jgi:hypothetical protein
MLLQSRCAIAAGTDGGPNSSIPHGVLSTASPTVIGSITRGSKLPLHWGIGLG